MKSPLFWGSLVYFQFFTLVSSSSIMTFSMILLSIIDFKTMFVLLESQSKPSLLKMEMCLHTRPRLAASMRLMLTALSTTRWEKHARK